eukprot:m.150481 g.150481  ORF g.150481 m.150481 type:complete len:149 (+) comp52796_c0_seq5:232-678(+)
MASTHPRTKPTQTHALPRSNWQQGCPVTLMTINKSPTLSSMHGTVGVRSYFNQAFQDVWMRAQVAANTNTKFRGHLNLCPRVSERLDVGRDALRGKVAGKQLRDQVAVIHLGHHMTGHRRHQQRSVNVMLCRKVLLLKGGASIEPAGM